MKIYEIHQKKRTYMPLLLLADEQPEMIETYLSRGRMFVLDDGGVKAESVVTDEGGGLRLDPRLRRLHRVCVDPCLEIFRVDYLSHYLHYSFRMIGGVDPHPKISQNALAAASISRIYP